MQVLTGGAKRDIIETLREVLDMAIGGELLCVAVVYAKKNEAGQMEFFNCWATDDDYTHSFVALMAGLEVAKYDLIKESDK